MINVNLKPCNCSHHRGLSTTCLADCASAPVPMPCPVPPTVTFEVRLGECKRDPFGCRGTCHASVCFARDVLVTCSISGKTWEESEVRSLSGFPATIGGSARDALHAACRARWALVKALVTGHDEEWRKNPKSEGWDLQPQRDAVFAALVDMARAELAAWESQERAVRAMGEPTFLPDNFHRTDPIARPSASILARFVERLIKQVRSLDGDTPNSPKLPDGSSISSLPLNGSFQACEHDPKGGPCEDCAPSDPVAELEPLLVDAGLTPRFAPERYPCSPTCTHDDALTPGHPERVKERSEVVTADLNRAAERSGDWWTGYSEGHDVGSNKMRAACWEAVQEALEPGFPREGWQLLWDTLKAAVDGVKP